MTFKLSILHSNNIKCPKCNHTYLYDFKIECFQEDCDENCSTKNQYNFLTYLICKNPLCHYDIEIKGDVIENSLNDFDSIKITSIK